MNKKLQNLALIMVIISCLTLFFAIGSPFIFRSIGSDNKFLYQALNFIASLGKLGLGLSGLNQENHSFFATNIEAFLYVNFFTIVVSLTVLIGSLQYITSKGKTGRKCIKLGLVIIACNCFVTFLYQCLKVYQLIFPSKLLSESQNFIYLIIYTISAIGLFIYVLHFSKALKKHEAEIGFKAETDGSSIFSDDTYMPSYEQTKTGYRFLNYITDLLVILIMSLNILGILVIVMQNVQHYRSGGFGRSTDLFDNDTFIKFIIFLSYSFFSIIYYTFFEKVFGYTAGKALTNTKVINEAGNGISMGQAFGRTFSRFVPFEWLSAFSGSMWHDNWTNTYTVDVLKANFNNNLNA